MRDSLVRTTAELDAANYPSQAAQRRGLEASAQLIIRALFCSQASVYFFSLQGHPLFLDHRKQILTLFFHDLASV